LVLWQGIGFLGVGLPFGEILGMLIYLTLFALFRRLPEDYRRTDPERSLLLIALIAAICAHFVEVHFGIAIAATRLYFWVYAGLLLAAGIRLPEMKVYRQSTAGDVPKIDVAATDEAVNTAKPARTRISESNRSRKGSRRRTSADRPNLWANNSLRRITITTLLTSVITSTLVFDYLNNLNRSNSALEILRSSFFSLPTENFAPSPAIFGLLVFVWITATLILGTEPVEKEQPSRTGRIREIGLALLSSGIITLLFSLWQAGRLAAIFKTTMQTQSDLINQIHAYANLPIWFLVLIFLLLIVMAWFLPDLRVNLAPIRRVASLAAGIALVPVALVLIYTTNISPIQADVMFKLASPFVQNNQWPGAILIYRQALDKAPREDHYYLFLGRAYLEYAKSLTDPAEKQAFMQQAVDDLKVAQDINPLNTDHTANLARLYSFWGSTVSDDQQKQEYFSLAEQYYQEALNLSPNNAALWMEKAVLQLNALGDPSGALESAEMAKELDPTYDRIYALLGDYYVQAANESSDLTDRREFYLNAAENYSKAEESLSKTNANFPVLHTYALALGGVYLELKETGAAIQAYQDAYQYANRETKWRIAETITRLYQQTGEIEQALKWARTAQREAPESEIDRLGELIRELESAP
jgi:hypothetical protein